MKIGDVIYLRPSHNQYFRKLEVLAETSRSWVVAPPTTYDWIKDAARKGDTRYNEISKVPKNLKGWVVGTEQEAILASWFLSNRYRIIKLAECLLKPTQMLEVAKMLNYTPLPEEPNVAS